MGVLFLGGVNGRLFAGLVVTGARTFALLILMSPWRRERIFAYLDPFADPLGKGYQLTHSLIAFGRGEWFGVGLGGSIEKLHYLPEAHTDFLLAVIGEELGLVGVLVVIVLFYWITRRAFEIGRQAIAIDRVFAGLVAKGIGAVDRLPGVHQHGRERRPAAHQGPDPAADELRRLRACWSTASRSRSCCGSTSRTGRLMRGAA